MQLQCGHVPVSNISRYHQDAGGFSKGAVLGVVSMFVVFDSIEKFEFEHSRFFLALIGHQKTYPRLQVCFRENCTYFGVWGEYPLSGRLLQMYKNMKNVV